MDPARTVAGNRAIDGKPQNPVGSDAQICARDLTLTVHQMNTLALALKTQSIFGSIRYFMGDMITNPPRNTVSISQPQVG